MGDSSSGRRTSGWQTGMIGWGVATVLAVGFFVALSLMQGYRLFSPAVPSTPLPAETPIATSTASRRPGTPGVEAVAAGVTPRWEPATPSEATIQAVVLNVLGNLLTLTPSVAPGATATATAEMRWTATPAAAGTGKSVQDGSVALWLSALTAITALIGLVSTVLLNWRREQREVEQARAELTKTQLEVEKLRRELGQ